MNAISLICHKPNPVWFDFLSTVTKYDVYMIIDDNSKNYTEEFSYYKNIHIIQINESDCITNGVINVGFFNRPVAGWDKAVYYFSHVNTSYDYVWFVEDDIFLNSEKTLLDIDYKYKDSDLLSNTYGENQFGTSREWHWPRIRINTPPPWYCAMVCSIRTSKGLLACIKEYANKHKTLFFLEAMFSTICKTNNLKYDTPDELKNVVYKRDYKDTDINSTHLFHPVKDIPKHEYYRTLLGGL
jgi:hypothetical protein